MVKQFQFRILQLFLHLLNPDDVFVVVANIIAKPGVFGFIMAALTAALMSTVDTLLNAIAAVYINDVHRPLKKMMNPKILMTNKDDKKELNSARIATIVFTILGVLAVLPFNAFPTVYEAHGLLSFNTYATFSSSNIPWEFSGKNLQMLQ